MSAEASLLASPLLYTNSGIHSDSFYASLIDSSTRKSHLRQIHARLLVLGLQFSGFLITKLIQASSSFGDVTFARQVFDGLPHPQIYPWNAIIRGYSRNNYFQDALLMYSKMHLARVSPDSFTFPHLLKACGGLSHLPMGRVVHAQVFRLGFEDDVFVQNGLIALYAKCKRLGFARTVFEGVPLTERTIVSWTAIVSGYAQNGEPVEALEIFSQMRKMGVKPDWVALVSVLNAFTCLQGLEQGRSVHASVVKMGLETEPDLLISLNTMYAKCGQVATAKVLFDKMTSPNLILWNAMISGYAKNGYAKDAIDMFHEMIDKDVRPDTISITSAVSACAQVGSLEQARWMDEYVGRTEYRDDVFISSALIDMFAKCGSVECARSVFDRTLDRDVVVWSAMIVGYGLHGRAKEAISLYRIMERDGVYPNDITFLGLLMACNHSGLVREGWWFFNRMTDHKINPQQQHYACVIDLLGRAGHMDQAYEVIKCMPVQPGVTVWGALLSACKKHRHVELGEYAAQQLFAIDPSNTGHYVQLSNLYAAARLWERVAEVRVKMKEKGLSKDVGCSWVEVRGRLEAFRVGDKSHPRYKEIERQVEWIESRLKEGGFVAYKDASLHDLNDEEAEETLCNHSERIAIAYGLISTPQGTTLRITKNLRACVNCHAATKLISKLVGREIVVRDTNRFHHFKDGVCSCNDYW
ncbi:PREDICTED: pentatricopeptide repeat-containing protein At3g12770-like [Camelina sativa]|uniref:Pentatricopeptide repeat-containing protein At3g12770-like n=1 Tax=Camelina sativa TaxID=90675 RepID=A0ABM1R1K4_CAMSA|nr:PREDICTED: pentatricopeptide repeat-containing protein At3g12770-like [Camelina sativa]